ncbi:hypothetical protein [Croceicoccus sp. BE223]|uniref:hypothetical protein n=1 Tax=Croceicoccus sp. BE223 TaxID=2817716 RepID=UPI00285D44C0|nr:hypothetical protein [Croceicoccus sp. BE223]MDR7102368.1 hypothetical protein [Croceicoccus sp. BE223]
MHNYQLKIAGRHESDGVVVEFESQDTAGALNRLSTFKSVKRAQLWEDGHFICTIAKDGGGPGVWSVDPER